MPETPVFSAAAVAAPHTLAAEAGRAVLAEGGNAIEAMAAMAATIAVVYPHMNAIGAAIAAIVSMALPPSAKTARPASAAVAEKTGVSGIASGGVRQEGRCLPAPLCASGAFGNRREPH